MASGTSLGLSSSLLYSIFYVVLSVNVFQGLFLFRKYRSNEVVATLSEFKSVFRALPVAASLFSLTFFSFAAFLLWQDFLVSFTL